MKNRFTQGPWRLIEKDGYMEIHGAERLFGYSSLEIAIIYMTEKEEPRANAQLLAVAPELLEALERLTSAAIDVDVGYLDEAIRQAEKAIAKARGEA